MHTLFLTRESDILRRVKDTDYLYISTRIKVLEKNMLTQEKYMRMASAKSDKEALKVLEENGWGAVAEDAVFSLDQAISKKQNEVLDLLYKYSPDRRLIDIFRLKYDYHNIKVYIKSQALNINADDIYSEAGVVPSKVLRTALRDKRSDDIPREMYEAALEAEDILARTRDPQLADLLLDKAHLSQMQSIANEIRSEFLSGYVSLYTDLCNLRVAARAVLAGKDRNYRLRAFSEGGSVDVTLLVNDNSAENIETLFSKTACRDAAEAAVSAITSDGSMSDFDKLADKAVMEYIGRAKLIPFGEAQIISYMIKAENERNSVRTIMTCRAIGMGADEIMERLRKNDV